MGRPHPAKVKSNLIEPPDLPGNPECVVRRDPAADEVLDVHCEVERRARLRRRRPARDPEIVAAAAPGSRRTSSSASLELRVRPRD
jgi:hypothetical protein